jgi:hypothetical protein
VCFAGREFTICLFVSVGVGDVGGYVSESSEEGVVLAGEVVPECGGNGVGEGKWRDVMEHGSCVALGSYQASECRTITMVPLRLANTLGWITDDE